MKYFCSENLNINGSIIMKALTTQELSLNANLKNKHCSKSKYAF